jgi:hypothetical protein
VKKIKVADTKGFLFLAREADRTDRNRRVNVERLEKVLDHGGVHVVGWTMIHNDVEMRTQWLLKVKDSDTPLKVFLDMSFEDYNALAEVET